MEAKLTLTKSLFDLHEFIKKAIVVSVEHGGKELVLQDENTNSHSTEENRKISEPKGEGILTCRMCNLENFESIAKHHEHYKSDWHKFNLKLRMNGVSCITEKEFLEIKDIGEISDESDNDEDKIQSESSIVPQDTQDSQEAYEDEVQHKSPKVIFGTSDHVHFALWRRILQFTCLEKDSLSYQSTDFVKSLKELTSKVQRWTYLMCSGGHFAGAVFENNKCIQHKTFHRYTVRKKQGGSQSSADNKSATSQPKSAGASMRRYNEQRLQQDVLEVLKQWKKLINSSILVFLSIPGQANKGLFFSKDSPLTKDDPRIKVVPFTTKRPTLVEIKRIHQILTTVEFLEYVALPDNDKPKVEDLPQQEVPRVVKLEEEEEDLENDAVVKSIRRGQLLRLQQLIQEGFDWPIPRDAGELTTPLCYAIEIFDCEEQQERTVNEKMEMIDWIIHNMHVDINAPVPKWNFRTALHRASQDGKDDIVLKLLQERADPTVKSLDSKTAYQVAKNSSTRNLFRRFAGAYPEMWKWEVAGIAPLTEEMEKEMERKKADKRKQKKKNQQEKARQKKVEDQEAKKKELEKLEQEKAAQELAKAEKERLKKMESMSDREKRAFAAENRIALANGSCRMCDGCQKPLTTVPFERLEFKYCTMICLLAHKKLIGR